VGPEDVDVLALAAPCLGDRVGHGWWAEITGIVPRVVLVFLMCGVTSVEALAQGPTPNVNDGDALQRECATALRAADDEPEAGRNPVERGSDMGQCLGLVSGVWHTHMMMVDEFDSRSAFCPTASIGAGEMARIVNRYLQTYPAELDQWDTVLILRAFMAVYPCS
jgi:hypothetical protein